MAFDSGVPELGRRAWVLVLMVMMMLKVVMLMLEMVMMMFNTGDDFVLKAGRSSWTLAGGRAKRHIDQVNKKDKREKLNEFMNKHKQNRVSNHERLLQLHQDIQREFELIKLVGTIFLY